MLTTMKAELFAARSILLSCAVAIDMQTATGQADWAARAAFLTPIAKSFGTETGIRVSETGVQVHGGMGFIEETGAAQYYRDVRVTAIYEGTNGIQAMDLVGRKMMDGGEAASNLIDEMQAQAAKNAFRPLLKIKLGTPDDMPRLEAVRAGAPTSRIIVDANEGWSAEVYADLAPHLVRLGVQLVEQPLPASQDEALIGMDRPVPVCADESCHDRASLPHLKGKYDVVNIKLDKTGGLTEALALRDAALAEGYKVMVGCMVGSSLAMAPATLVAQGALVTDLDGPLLLGEDREVPLEFDDKGVHPPAAALWG